LTKMAKVMQRCDKSEDVSTAGWAECVRAAGEASRAGCGNDVENSVKCGRFRRHSHGYIVSGGSSLTPSWAATCFESRLRICGESVYLCEMGSESGALCRHRKRRQIWLHTTEPALDSHTLFPHCLSSPQRNIRPDLETPAMAILRSSHRVGKIKPQAKSFKELVSRLGQRSLARLLWRNHVACRSRPVIILSIFIYQTHDVQDSIMCGYYKLIAFR
jgi:hypothetical protein